MGCSSSKQKKTTPPPKETKPVEEKKEVDPNADNIKFSVTIVGARDLQSTDINGKADPFCCFYWRGIEYKTSIEYKTLEPEWDATFECLFNQNKDEKTLNFKIFDYNNTIWDEAAGTAGEPDLMGSAEFSLWEMMDKPDGIDYQKDIALTGKAGDEAATGALKIKVNCVDYLPTEQETVQPDGDPASVGVDVSALRAAGATSAKIDSLEVLVMEAAGLRAADSFGKSDPMTQIIWKGKKYESKVKKQTLDPSWNEHIYLPFDPETDPKDFVITVWDWDKGRKNDFLGHVAINFEGLAMDQIAEGSYALAGPKAKGSIKLAFTLREKEPAWTEKDVIRFQPSPY